MIRFALYDYIPQRYLNRATFEEIDLHRRILDFKDGKGYATRWAAKKIGCALSDMDLSDTYIVCIPACEWCGAKNGFDIVQVFGHRQKAHINHVYELMEQREQRQTCLNFAESRRKKRVYQLADNADDFIHINDTFFKGKNIIVVDDIVTTGKTANAFIDRMVSAGANVKMADLQQVLSPAAQERVGCHLSSYSSRWHFTLVFSNSDGTTDHVSAAEFTQNSESDIFYNTMGQKVNPNAKGIVIKNRKKIVNR